MKRIAVLLFALAAFCLSTFSVSAPVSAVDLEFDDEATIKEGTFTYVVRKPTEEDKAIIQGAGGDVYLQDHPDKELLFIEYTHSDSPRPYVFAFIPQRVDEPNLYLTGSPTGGCPDILIDPVQGDDNFNDPKFNGKGCGSLASDAGLSDFRIDVTNPDVAKNFVEYDAATNTWGNSDIQDPDDDGEASSANEPEASCSGLALIGWVMCPMIELLYKAISALFTTISNNFLVIEPLNDQPGTPDSPHAVIFNIWNSFRILANIGFVIVFLIAIIGNAYGFLLDAYDFKKVVPRLGIAFIGVQLSWYICGFVIDFFNIMGAGIRSLMLAPVQGLQTIDLDFGTLGEFVGVMTAGGAAAIARFALGLKGILGLLPFILLPIVLGILITLFVLAVRQMLVFLLVVVSPVAFVCGILPGTEKVFKAWWDLFWKTLMMYPLIIALIASGELTAKLLVAGNQTEAIYQIIGLIALFAPYFLIPYTFKFAGNIISNIGSGFQRASHKIRDRTFGDIRDPFSYRARRRGYGQQRRVQRTGEFVARNRAGMPTGLTGAHGIRKSLARGYRARNTGGVRGAYRGLKGAAGGAVGAGYLRLGGSADEKIAQRTAEAREWGKSVGAAQTEALMAQLGYGRYKDDDGNLIAEPFYNSVVPQRYVNEATQHRDDAARTTVALSMLMTKAGSQQNVEALRAQMNRMVEHGDLTHEQAHQAWETATHDNEGIHGDLKYRNPFSEKGEIQDKYLTEFLRKSADTQMSYHMENQRETFWKGLKESHDRLATGTPLEGAPPGDEVRAKEKFNEIRDNTLKNLYDSHAFRYKEDLTNELRSRGIKDANGKDLEFNALLSEQYRPVLNQLIEDQARKSGATSADDFVINKAIGGRQTISAFNAMKEFLTTTRKL